MKTKLFHAAAALIMSATFAHAAITSDDLVAQYQAQGYTRIEIKVGSTLAKVEAIKDGQKVEVLVDLVTGAILKTETEQVQAGDDVTPGVEVRSVSDEKLDDDKGRGQSGGEDDDDSNDDNGDDSGDDDGGDDDGGDDDSGDDDGGNSGGDDDGDNGDDD
jgi:hypothetical protein